MPGTKVGPDRPRVGGAGVDAQRRVRDRPAPPRGESRDETRLPGFWRFVMRTANVMFAMMLGMTAGCATTLDQVPAAESGAGPTTEAVFGAEGACVVTGGVNTIAPKAQIRPGLELVSTANGLALGFGMTAHDAIAVKIDPRSGRAVETASRHSSDRIRRVTPRERGADLDLSIDADCKANMLKDSITISTNEPLVVGTVDSDISWSSCAA